MSKLTSFEKFVIRKQAKGLCKSMNNTIVALSTEFPNKKASEYGMMAIKTRGSWVELRHGYYVVISIGKIVSIKSGDDLLTIYKNIFEAELTRSRTDFPAWALEEIYEYGKNELEAIYKNPISY